MVTSSHAQPLLDAMRIKSSYATPTAATPFKVYARRTGKFLAVLFWTVIFGFIFSERLMNICKDSRSTHFPFTDGIVTSAGLRESYKSGGEPHFSPDVHFAYE